LRRISDNGFNGDTYKARDVVTAAEVARYFCSLDDDPQQDDWNDQAVCAESGAITQNENAILKAKNKMLRTALEDCIMGWGR